MNILGPPFSKDCHVLFSAGAESKQKADAVEEEISALKKQISERTQAAGKLKKQITAKVGFLIFASMSVGPDEAKPLVSFVK